MERLLGDMLEDALARAEASRGARFALTSVRVRLTLGGAAVEVQRAVEPPALASRGAA